MSIYLVSKEHMEHSWGSVILQCVSIVNMNVS